jgi:predicted nuclease of predicted toxin-antitoxin system
MDILVDENIPLISVDELCNMGHDVLDIRGTAEEGLSDEQLWNKASQEKRLLITTDRGFAHYRDREHRGILIVSLRRPNRDKINERVIEAMKLFSPEQWPGLLVVMRDKTMSTWRSGKEK